MLLLLELANDFLPLALEDPGGSRHGQDTLLDLNVQTEPKGVETLDGVDPVVLCCDLIPLLVGLLVMAVIDRLRDGRSDSH